jgi:NADPH:quinone reductase-like Zn-dependent oxidoreductase
MKAVVWTRRGPPEVLELQEVDRPSPKDDEVQVKVHAASINSWDWELMAGVAQITFGGRTRPPRKILGCDISGTVVGLGSKVKHFQPGDEVFGDISASGFGGFAEYVCVKEKALAPKSASVSHEEAAATPQASLLALQGLRKGRIEDGQKVLINGAGGGVGTFAIQIAKSFGTEVTGVDSTEKLDAMRSIGADHVIDYTKEDFTKRGQVYDLILDVTSKRSVFDYKRALTPGGVCIILGGKGRKIMGSVFLGSWALGSRKVRLLLLKQNPTDLVYMNELLEAGKVVPVIDRRFPLSEVAEAFRYIEKGQYKGKIVVTVT